MQERVRHIGSKFEVLGEFIEAVPFGNGHINDTFAVRYDQGGNEIRYIHQRINHHIFPDPPAQMENIHRVTSHLYSKLEPVSGHTITREVLTVVPAKDGSLFHKTEDGNYWRTYVMIEDSHSVDVADTLELARETGAAFGKFQALLADFQGPRLHEIIPNFHHTPKRLAALDKAIEQDALGRVKTAIPEIDSIHAQRSLAGQLIDAFERGELPERIVHYDTKINNVLIDTPTGKNLCVVDLDTVMSGLVAYDFGDMVRTVTSPAQEDEKDLSKVSMRMPYFKALTEGYLEETSHFLNAAEIQSLIVGGKILPYTIGIRFLTDYLSGDQYFRTHYDNHNLIRCRTQLKLLQSINDQENEMNKVIEPFLK